MKNDFKSLFDQITGKNNVFGYKKASINRIHLMYWILGEFYQSDVFDKRIISILKLFNLGNLLIIFTMVSSYMFLSSSREYSKILFVIELSAITTHSMVLLPLVACISRKHTLEAFKILDQDDQVQVHDTNSTSRKKYSHSSKVMKVQLCVVAISTTLVYFDLIYKYNDEKLKNAEYYMYPVYCEKVDNLATFSMLLGFEMVSVFPIIVMAFLLPIFSITLAGEFYEKFQNLCRSLDRESELFLNRTESNLASKSRKDTADLQDIFIRNVYRAARCHMRLLSGIRRMRSYFEHMMSITAVMFLVVEVVLIFLTIHVNEKSLVRKMKFLCYASGISIIVFVNCLVGKLFTDMGQMFNDIVYGSSWYYLSPSRRKSVYLLLYQSQIPIEFKALKIFPKSMAFLLKLCRYVYSFVNVLRFAFAVRDM